MNSVTYTAHALSFGYSETPVLAGIDLTFEPGMFHAIVGPNGSGKSTLLDLLTGHRGPSSGNVRINNADITGYSPDQLARLTAMVPQDTTFNFPFTVFDTVLMGCHPRIPRFAKPSDDDIRTVRSAMAAMDIEHLADRAIPDLSGGERQRTVFARALAQDTPCLLLDEPTSSMDIRHALTAMSILRRLAHDENRTVIAVLHDLNLASAHCDSVTVLHQGNVKTVGSPTQALTPQTIQEVFGVTAHAVQCPETNTHTITYESKK